LVQLPQPPSLRSCPLLVSVIVAIGISDVGLERHGIDPDQPAGGIDAPTQVPASRHAEQAVDETLIQQVPGTVAKIACQGREGSHALVAPCDEAAHEIALGGSQHRAPRGTAEQDQYQRNKSSLVREVIYQNGCWQDDEDHSERPQ